MPHLRQETVAIIGVGVMLFGMGVTLAVLGLSVAEGLRDEIRAVRAEARAGREEFQRQILRLTERQGQLTGLVEGLLREQREAEEAPAP